mgnify:CR=1 FL=1
MWASVKPLKVLLTLYLFVLSLPAFASFEVEDARLRKPLPGQSTAVIYLQVTNRFERDAQLASAHLVPVSTDAGSRLAWSEPVVEVHEHRHIDGMMSMRRVSGLTIAAGDTLVFAPGGYHLMVFGLTSAVEALQLLLRFSDGRELQVPLRLESL